VVVFHPHPWRLQADVELEYNALTNEGAHLGDGVPLQRTRPLTTMSSARARLVFPADVPPLGYRVYRLYKGGIESDHAVRATRSSLENEHLLLELNPATGRISKLVHKASAANLAAPDARHAVVVNDLSDTWGHGVRAYDDELGEFQPTSVRLLENGPVRAVLRAESRWDDSSLREDYVLAAGARYIDVRVTIDWHEQLKLLKLRYPTSVQSDRATFEVPYGHLERPAGGDEEPGQAWVDVSDGSRGLAVLNDAKYGYDVRSGDIGVTAVRSPVWAWHDPRELEDGGEFEFMDQGRQSFTVRLVPHAGDWRRAGVVRLAAELNQSAYPLLETYHGGSLPQQASFAADGEGPVVVTVIKLAEDGDGAVIVRAYESAGAPASARIELPLVERTVDAEFGAHEIKTFRVPRDPAQPVTEVNLLEW
jgi:alpha-mannosidase